MMWADVAGSLRRLYRSTQKNARVRGLAFEMTREEFAALWAASGGRCAVLGRPFDLAGDERGEWRRNPWAPSLDRISSRAGYSAGNCRLVCVAVNIAMNEWGLDVLREVAHGLFGSSPGAELSRSGSGLLRGISSRTYKGERRFDVRIYVNGRPKNCGRFRDYEAAVRRLTAARAQADSAVQVSVGPQGSRDG